MINNLDLEKLETDTFQKAVEDLEENEVIFPDNIVHDCKASRKERKALMEQEGLRNGHYEWIHWNKRVQEVIEED